MAPPEETKALSPAAAASGGSEAAGAVDEAERQTISTVLIIVVMQTEALPIASKFQLSEDTDECLFPKGVPWVRYNGKYKDLSVNLVWTLKYSILGVDSVGTAGGFKAKGASIGDLYLASDVAYHDRRIPIPVFDQYGIGARRTLSTPNLLKELNLKVGRLSTGDSLDMSPRDEGAILANDDVIKDMEKRQMTCCLMRFIMEISPMKMIAQNLQPRFDAQHPTPILGAPRRNALNSLIQYLYLPCSIRNWMLFFL